jgi:N-methylhydantoinase B
MSETATPERVDPVTFRIIKHRLTRVTDEAVSALKRVSGSATTNEGHDLMVALYTKEGDLLTGGVGFLHHYVGASEATKHVIDRFSGDIDPGDRFLLNDPYTAALHAPDVYLITPIFHGGELRAFAANFVHVADLGSIDPGGFAPNSRSVFHEGFQTPGLKLIEGGEMRTDVLETIRNMSRDPGRLEADIRSQIAANNVATDRMRKLMDQYGEATVSGVGADLIDQSARAFRRRLRELPDGTWEARQYLRSAPEDRTYTIKLALRKEGDALTFDFAGTDEQSEVGLNCTEIGTRGGVLAPLLPLVCHDMTWNDGIVEQIDVEAPAGSLVNARRPAPVSIATVATLQICNSLATLAVSRMLGASEAYADRATGVWHGAHAGIGFEITDGGETSVGMVTDTFAGAGGGRAVGDGIDLGGEITNVVTRWANAERHEGNQPIRFLGRRFVPESGGPGENRGGAGHEYAVTPVNALDVDEVIVSTSGRGTEIPKSTGVFGGYPGCTVAYTAFRGSTPEGETAFPDPTDPDAEAEEIVWGNHPIDDDDAVYVRTPGSGGYGDPLARDPEAVAADVARGIVTPEAAEAVYGVPATADGEIDGDVAACRERRFDRRRAEEGFEAPASPGDVEDTALRLGEHVAVVADGATRYVACGACEAVLAEMGPDWKGETAVSGRPVSEAGLYRDCPDDLRLREFCCPACGRLLDTEMAFADDPHLEQVVRESPRTTEET